MTPSGAEMVRFNDASASCMRPLRTSHQGDSGANQVAINKGNGNTHWRAKGSRYDHCEGMSRVPVRTPVDKSLPITQHRFTNVVRYPRSTIGHISEAYDGVAAAKKPHGIEL